MFLIRISQLSRKICSQWMLHYAPHGDNYNYKFSIFSLPKYGIASSWRSTIGISCSKRQKLNIVFVKLRPSDPLQLIVAIHIHFLRKTLHTWSGYRISYCDICTYQDHGHCARTRGVVVQFYFLCILRECGTVGWIYESRMIMRWDAFLCRVVGEGID